MVLELRVAHYALASCSYFWYARFLSGQSSFAQIISSSHALCPVFPPDAEAVRLAPPAPRISQQSPALEGSVLTPSNRRAGS